MKKYIVLISISMLAFSCVSIETNVLKEPASSLATKSETSIVDDKCITNEFSVSRALAMQYANLHHHGEEYTMDAFAVETDTTLFVFNYKGGGWLVVPGDMRWDPVLAESNEGKIDINSDDLYVQYIRSMGCEIAYTRSFDVIPDKEIISRWSPIMNTAKSATNEVYLTKASSPKWVIRKYAIEENTTYSTEVSHLIQTNWGQKSPWNSSMPIFSTCTVSSGSGLPSTDKCTAGCAAVAIAQILYYFHNNYATPNALYESVSCNSSITSYTKNIGLQLGSRTEYSNRWSQMPLSLYDYGNYSYVSDLLLEVGHFCEMYYSCLHNPNNNENGSGTSIYLNTPNIWSRYGIRCQRDMNYSVSSIESDLRSSKPVLISASSAAVGHVWLIDGLQYERRDYTMMRYCEYSSEWTSADETFDSFESARQRYGFADEYDVQIYQGDPVIVKHWLMNWGEDGRGDNYTYGTNPYWANYSLNGNIQFNFSYLCRGFDTL